MQAAKKQGAPSFTTPSTMALYGIPEGSSSSGPSSNHRFSSSSAGPHEAERHDLEVKMAKSIAMGSSSRGQQRSRSRSLERYSEQSYSSRRFSSSHGRHEQHHDLGLKMTKGMATSSLARSERRSRSRSPERYSGRSNTQRFSSSDARYESLDMAKTNMTSSSFGRSERRSRSRSRDRSPGLHQRNRSRERRR